MTIGKPFVTEEAKILLRNDLTKAINNEDFADVYFKVGDTQFAAHKAIISFRSPVFRELFSSNANENTVGETNSFNVEEARKNAIEESNGTLIVDVEKLANTTITPESFRIILTYLYNGELMINHENCLNLYSLSRRLNLGSAVSSCKEYLDELKGGPEVCGLLAAALESNEMELYTQCMESFEQKTRDCLESEVFLHLPERIIETIITNEKITCTEKELFDAIIRWWGARKDEIVPEGDKQAQDKYLVDRFLYHVRFPLMNPGDISEIERMKLIDPKIIMDSYRFHACKKYQILSDDMKNSETAFRFRERNGKDTNAFSFDSSKKGTELELSNENNTVEIKQQGLTKYLAVLADKGFTTGVHLWEVKINSQVGHIMVGVSTKGQNLENWIGSDQFGWSWFGSSGTKYHRSSSKYTTTFKTGDIIGVKLNLSNNTSKGAIYFYKNGKPMGRAFTELNEIQEMLYPSVSLRETGDSVTLTSTNLVHQASYANHLNDLEQ